MNINLATFPNPSLPTQVLPLLRSCHHQQRCRQPTAAARAGRGRRHSPPVTLPSPAPLPPKPCPHPPPHPAPLPLCPSPGLFQFCAIVNINLAAVNLLPLPALDGGYLLLLAIEALRGKKLPQALEQGVMASGLLVMMFLGVGLVIRDTINLL